MDSAMTPATRSCESSSRAGATAARPSDAVARFGGDEFVIVHEQGAPAVENALSYTDRTRSSRAGQSNVRNQPCPPRRLIAVAWLITFRDSGLELAGPRTIPAFEKRARGAHGAAFGQRVT